MSRFEQKMCAIVLWSVTNWMGMAEETDKPSPKPNEGEAISVSDDMIDLEGLVRNIDLTPTDSLTRKKGPPVAAEVSDETAVESPLKSAAVVPAAATPAPPAHEPEVEEESRSLEVLDPRKFDEILNIEDPEIAKQIEAIRADGFKHGEGGLIADDDDSLAIHPLAKLSFRERIRFAGLKIGSRIRASRAFAIRLVKDSKGVSRELMVAAKASLIASVQTFKAKLAGQSAWLNSRSLAQKIALLVSLIALGLLVFVSAKTMQGTLLPTVERAWIASFTDYADGTFTYDANGPSENFNDPLLHPEFVILVERIVVNLKRTAEASDSANPMAAFELYLQTDTQDAAVEIKDRSVEIRDAVARSVERMTYPDLADEDGKAKLKLLIRKDLNEVITRGKVRRVFFKTIVLNPES